MGDVLEGLHKEHQTTAKLLKVIDGEVELFLNGEQPDWEILQEALDYLQEYSDLFHHPKEDVIFRLMKELDPDKVQSVGDLEDEHGRLVELTDRFVVAVENVLQDNTLTREWFGVIAGDFLKFQRQHMDMEEVLFFPAAKKILNSEDWAEIAIEISKLDVLKNNGSISNRYKLLNVALDLDETTPS